MSDNASNIIFGICTVRVIFGLIQVMYFEIGLFQVLHYVHQLESFISNPSPSGPSPKPHLTNSVFPNFCRNEIISATVFQVIACHVEHRLLDDPSCVIRERVGTHLGHHESFLRAIVLVNYSFNVINGSWKKCFIFRVRVHRPKISIINH